MGKRFNDFSRGLAGFGAGVQGRGTQFLQQLDENRQMAMAEDAFKLQGALNNNDISGARDLLMQRVGHIGTLNGDSSDSQGYLDRLNAGDVQGVLQDINTDVDYAYSAGLLKPNAGRGNAFRQNASAPIIDPTTGAMSMPVFDPNTGQARLESIPGAVQETPAQKRTRDAQAAAGTKRSSLQASRGSELRKEVSERNREAARSQVKLRRGLLLAQTASQGVSGELKLQLSRLLPGVDVEDEGALDATFKQLALDQLQMFKGPTTDFEYGVAQSIAGGIGQSKNANISRLKSLDRNAWFNRREYEQLNKHLGQGKNPDDFAFNFNEGVRTKRGTYSLMDLQDTAVAENMTIDEVLKELNK